jgi:predicted  nucleic acid-binding Zn-ribbon protein
MILFGKKREYDDEEYFWCRTCHEVSTMTGIEYIGGCWNCGGQMFSTTGVRPPMDKIRTCRKKERLVIRSGRDALGRNVFARAVAACGYRLRQVVK